MSDNKIIMQDFSSLQIPAPLQAALEKCEFKTPTPIQAQAIPPALEGKDILGSAQTGTGKTAAFGIPLVAHLMANPDDGALVMAPTRELSLQVMQALQALCGKNSGIKTTLLIGGASIYKQLSQLRAHPRLIVGTPGRINDHLARKTLDLRKTRFLVLDETDRMLDIGFTEQINKIIKRLPEQHQTLLFSATLPKNITAIANKYMHDPVRVSVGPTSLPVPKIKQEILRVSQDDKYNQLLTQLEEREGSILIFVKTKRGAEKMAQRLRFEEHSTDTIHGNLRQNKRDRVISAFRNKKYRIMVATDVAARGLDIPHIEHVINYDLPQCPEDYVHRIGRTGRAGAKGSALCFVTPADRKKWNAINCLIDPDAKPDKPSRRHGPKNKTGPHKRSANKYRGKGQEQKRTTRGRPQERTRCGDQDQKRPYRGRPQEGARNGNEAQKRPHRGRPQEGARNGNQEQKRPHRGRPQEGARNGNEAQKRPHRGRPQEGARNGNEAQKRPHRGRPQEGARNGKQEQKRPHRGRPQDRTRSGSQEQKRTTRGRPQERTGQTQGQKRAPNKQSPQRVNKKSSNSKRRRPVSIA